MHMYLPFLMWRIEPPEDILISAPTSHNQNVVPSPPPSKNMSHDGSSLHWRLASDKVEIDSSRDGEHHVFASIS